MPSVRRRWFKDRPELAVAAVGSALILAGALLWLVPYLTRTRRSVAEIPSPPALVAISKYTVPPGKQACMSSVGVTPNSRLAQFRLRAQAASAQGSPPIELMLSAPGYAMRARLAGGYPAGSVLLPILAPKHALIARACFVNVGHTNALLDGSTEARTVSRSATRIDGRPVVGDIALAFLDSRQRSLLDRLGEVFGHASNLTGDLVPAWLIWILAMLVAFGAPIGAMAAFYWAMREDKAASAR
jgi:hypothetical protein